MCQLRFVVMLAVAALTGCQPARTSATTPPAMQTLAVNSATQTAPAPVVQPTTYPVDAGATESFDPTTQAIQAITSPAGIEPTTAPATQPTTAPATQETTTQPATTQDTPATTQAAESPKEALVAVMNATVRGDVEGVRKRLHAEGEESSRMASAMMDVAEAARKVRDASAAKFGWDKLHVLDIDIVPPIVVAGAIETIEGERATVQLPGHGGVMVMRRVNGGWRISLAELLDVQKKTRSIDQVIEEARDPAQRLNALAGRVEAGEFKTIEEVLAALAQSLYAAGETVKKQ